MLVLDELIDLMTGFLVVTMNRIVKRLERFTAFWDVIQVCQEVRELAAASCLSLSPY